MRLVAMLGTDKNSRRHLLERTHDPLDSSILTAHKVIHVGLDKDKQRKNIST
jgi:hypothetical protein